MHSGAGSGECSERRWGLGFVGVGEEVGEKEGEGEAVLLIAFQGFLHALFFVFHHL